MQRRALGGPEASIMKRENIDRRHFLTTIGRASGAGATGAVLLPALNAPAQAYDPGPDERRARYQADAPDVKAFYRTNFYETLKR